MSDQHETPSNEQPHGAGAPESPELFSGETTPAMPAAPMGTPEREYFSPPTSVLLDSGRPRSHRGRSWPVIAAGVLAVGAVGGLIGNLAFAPTSGPALTSAASGGLGSHAAGGGYTLPGSGGGGINVTLPGGGAIQVPGSARLPVSGSGSASTAVGAPSNTAALAQGIDPAVVDINTNLSYESEQAAGTGIVISSSGLVLTNNHVITGATSISVTDIGNSKTYQARVVGYDKTDDVAVIQLKNASGLTTANLGDSSTVKVGDGVVGVGNAEGAGGTPSYAGGAVTQVNQSITASDAGAGTSERLHGLIGTNANIEPGDSGGPLLNSNGQVIGIDTAGSSSGSGFGFVSPNSSSTDGFAIPITTAMTIAHKIIAGTASTTVHIGTTAFLGVSVESTSQASSGTSAGGLGNGYGNGSGFGNGYGGGYGNGYGEGVAGNTGNSGTTSPSLPSSGAYIANVVQGSPAATAGLSNGDTIISIDGKAIASPTSLSTQMIARKPGTSIQLGYVDASGANHVVSVKLASGPAQ